MDARVTRSGSEPLRIGIDAQALQPGTTGVSRSVRHLLGRLPYVAPRFRYVIYAPPRVPLPRELDQSAVRIVRPVLPTRRRSVKLLWQQAVLPRRLRSDRISLLHAPAYTTPLLSPVPVVLTIYDTIALKFPELCRRLNPIHFRLMLPRSARRAARIIVPSRTSMDHVVETCRIDADKIRVIPLGVSPEFQPVEDPELLATARRELDLPETYILFVGNLEPKKNLATLIEAFAELRRSGRVSCRLAIAGQRAWGWAEIARAIKKHRVGHAVQFLGWVPDRLLPLIMAGASAFVFPSLCEGFGLPPLEAMACGTPVVAGAGGAVPEVVGGAALTVPPRSARELAIAIEKVLTNRFLASRLRELGLRRAKAFSWDETARRTAAVYDEVLAGET